MKKIDLALLAVFCLLLFSIQCSRDMSPVGPGLSAEAQSEGAVLVGNFIANGRRSLDFSAIEVSIKDTSLRACPDMNGEFHMDGVPTGDQCLEVDVGDNKSLIDIADIQSKEEIRMQLQVQEDNSVILQDMTRDKKDSEDLQLEIRPKKWNIDWENSMDEGHARIYGAGFETISYVEIKGPTGIVIPVTRIEIGGVYYKAFFSQSAAIAAIPDPQRGDFCEITVTVSQDSETHVLTYTIEIVGAKPEPDDPAEPEVDLTMDISPDQWNTNWTKSNGYVTVRIRGVGFDEILPGVTIMNYNGGPPISPYQDGIQGSSYSAKFHKKDAIALFADPKKGDAYSVDVTVQFSSSTTLTMSYTISIVGPNK